MASGSPTIASLPINPVRVRCRYERSPVRFESPWSGKGQVLRRFGRWRLAMEWERLTAAQADAWPVPLHDIGMQAARAAGYVGADHPAGY